jgi:hypothetical protein
MPIICIFLPHRLGMNWRERILCPLTTLRLFVLQILFANTSITHLRQLSGMDFAPASYCAARQKLSLRGICRLIQWTVEKARQVGAKRAIIETIIDQLNIGQIEHSRHRSVSNYFADILAGLVAYTYKDKFPSLNLQPTQLQLIKGHWI